METVKKWSSEHPYLSYVLGGSLAALTLFKLVRTVRKRPDSDTRAIASAYDYIVIGSGSSGAVLASRLSEDPNVTVLLLEAGGVDSGGASHIPLAAPTLQKGPLDWAFQTVPQKHSHYCFKGNRSNWPRGKVLGGSSVLNWMLYVRGDASDYDSWQLPGWSFKDVLPWFLRSEDCRIASLSRTDTHSVGGPLPVSAPPTLNAMHTNFVRGCAEAGIPRNDDYNSGNSLGASVAQVTTRDGQRWSTARAFLGDVVAQRPNLTVISSAHVTQILFTAPEGKENVPTARGVAFHRGRGGRVADSHATLVEVSARREVVLSAGAVGSPHLLLLSGIGPRAMLEQHGIPVVRDVAGVGQNLQDHLFMPLTWTTNTRTVTPADANLLNFLQYKLCGTGPLSSTGLDSMCFLRTGLHPEMPYPDMQIHFVAAGSNRHGGNLNFDMSQLTDFESRTDLPPYRFAMVPTLLHPKSRGHIALHSRDPFAAPLIDPNYLAEQDDVDTIVAGVRKCVEIAATPTMAPHCGVLLSTDIFKNAPVQYKADPEAYWKHLVRSMACTVYHPVGTCKMGLDNDPMAVVDTQLRVRGVHGLRVVDCSIMPTLPSANTHAPAIMIGERGADFIRRGQN